MKLFSLLHPLGITLLCLQFAALITAAALPDDTTPAPEHALIQTFRLTNTMCQGWRDDVAAYREGQEFSDEAVESALGRMRTRAS
ncbi:hypothetical protein L211DRAFT_833944 [Terfezia boudieri ATCC MYA-4762]|uniref:Uncharacterized protein n=1 Tax=Terfezia boudieri ATCC MYA-4762 TaxID=1051890 RepID=A0A3N4M4W8_9PEZI|nr:hypothetical protein L211DRAFT_833944 [Terfezia boudieri ATCC MYA-4762]